MSAHCNICGTDMVYIGEYPMMECPVCELRKENKQLKDALGAANKALREARPYVFNRTQESDWRGETARDVLTRVDAALAGAVMGGSDGSS